MISSVSKGNRLLGTEYLVDAISITADTICVRLEPVLGSKSEPNLPAITPGVVEYVDRMTDSNVIENDTSPGDQQTFTGTSQKTGTFKTKDCIKLVCAEKMLCSRLLGAPSFNLGTLNLWQLLVSEAIQPMGNVFDELQSARKSKSNLPAITHSRALVRGLYGNEQVEPATVPKVTINILLDLLILRSSLDIIIL
ncbi:hypothetical protein J6590_017638 [Homalodisca vitripennis]|nr:hypothetical protein J6590_017638 [Homalodisca vitripennis]